MSASLRFIKDSPTSFQKAETITFIFRDLSPLFRLGVRWSASIPSEATTVRLIEGWSADLH